MLALTGHSGQVTSLAFSPDGRWLATAGWDGTVRLWERPAYRQVRCMRTPYDHAVSVDFSSDNSFLAIQFRNRDYTHDRDFGNVAWTPAATDHSPDYLPPENTWLVPYLLAAKGGLAVRPGSHVVAMHRWGIGIALWDAVSRSQIRQFGTVWNKSLADMRFAQNNAALAVLTDHTREANIHIWVGRKRQPSSLTVRDEQGRAISFLSGRKVVVCGFASGRMLWWDGTRRSASDMAQASNSGIVDISPSPDGSSLLLACEDGLIRLWDVAAREVRATYDWKIGTIQCVAYAPDGLTAAAAGDGVVLVWDVD